MNAYGSRCVSLFVCIASFFFGAATQNLTAQSSPFKVTISSPGNNSTDASPVHLVASYNGSPSYMKVWIDHVAGTALHNTSTVDQMLMLGNGTHLIEVQGHESTNNITYTSSVSITVATQAGLTVSPSNVSLQEGFKQVFTASESPVTWSTTGDGAINSSGSFTAGNSAGSAVVTATDSTGKTASASVTVTTLTINPSSVTTVEGQQQQFSAQIAVTWTASCGTISSTGIFTAPNVVEDCTITANASDGSARSGTAVDHVSAQLPPSDMNYVTWKNDNGRTGQQRNEKILTPASVKASFGVKFTATIDGEAYAQPLYMSDLRLGGSSHDVVFVATEHNSVYAFDADSGGAPLWKTSFLINGATTVPQGNVGSTINPEIGVTGTPVIDLSSNTLFVVAQTLEAGKYVHRLHALDVTNGSEKLGGPKVIAASGFASKEQLQRAGLVLANGNVYIAFASHGDHQPYNGWVFAYSATTLALTASWNVSPGGTEGGIWGGGGGIAADSNGDIYVSTGNGSLNGTTQFSMSIVKLSPSLKVLDWFAPWDAVTQSKSDQDVGAGGVLVVPDQSGAFPHELIECGKLPQVYVLNRDNLGHRGTSSDSQIVQELKNVVGGTSGRQANDHCFMTPAYWEGNLYFVGNNDVMKAFTLNPATGHMSTAPKSKTSASFLFPGAQAVVSSNGASNGIVWVVSASNVLHAYDATNLANQLYAGPTMPFTKWSVPTVINGMVYVGTKGKLYAYGL
jgi:hypothetical protein